MDGEQAAALSAYSVGAYMEFDVVVMQLQGNQEDGSETAIRFVMNPVQARALAAALNDKAQRIEASLALKQSQSTGH
jgi:hypothetical protein